MQPETEQVITEARALVAAVTHDDSGQLIGTIWTGGNGGLLSRETLRVADALRLALDAHDRADKSATREGEHA